MRIQRQDALEELISRLRYDQAYLVLNLDEMHLLSTEDIRGLLHISEQFGSDSHGLDIRYRAGYEADQELEGVVPLSS